LVFDTAMLGIELKPAYRGKYENYVVVLRQRSRHSISRSALAPRGAGVGAAGGFSRQQDRDVGKNRRCRHRRTRAWRRAGVGGDMHAPRRRSARHAGASRSSYRYGPALNDSLELRRTAFLGDNVRDQSFDAIDRRFAFAKAREHDAPADGSDIQQQGKIARLLFVRRYVFEQ